MVLIKFLKKCKELDDIKEHKTWAAEKWREYQLQNIENIFLAEKKQAEDEYKADKKTLREKMMNTAMEKRKKLLEEKSTMNLTDFSDGNERMMTRTTRSKRGNKDAKEQPSYKRRLNPPHINYTLKENEIAEDIGLIQKASVNQPSFPKHTTNNNNITKPTLPPTLPSEIQRDIYTDRGKLFYYNQVFEKGKDIFVECKQIENTGRWHGVIVLVNPAEIHIRSPDGTKSRFPLTQLRYGKYTISAAN